SGNDVAGPDIAAAQAGGAMVDARNAVDLLLAVDAEQGIAESSLDLAREMVARGRHRVVHALEDAERRAVLQSFDDLPRGEGAEAADIQTAGGNALLVAEVVNRDLGRLHVAAHADEDELGVLAAVRLDEPIAPAGLLVEQLEALFQNAFNAVVIP